MNLPGSRPRLNFAALGLALASAMFLGAAVLMARFVVSEIEFRERAVPIEVEVLDVPCKVTRERKGASSQSCRVIARYTPAGGQAEVVEFAQGEAAPDRGERIVALLDPASPPRARVVRASREDHPVLLIVAAVFALGGVAFGLVAASQFGYSPLRLFAHARANRRG